MSEFPYTGDRAEVVRDLRKLSRKLKRVKGDAVFFPEKEGHEVQPVTLEGYVPISKVATLLYYIADMLE